jgi:hypothetical protein
MSQRSGELLVKAIRALPADEQDELLSTLLAQVAVPAEEAGPRLAALRGAPTTDIFIPAWTDQAIQGSGIEAERQPLGRIPDSLVEQAQALRVLPVRLPTGDYERLRTWSKEHDFSMAVIIRTLVERFLDGQQAARPD